MRKLTVALGVGAGVAGAGVTLGVGAAVAAKRLQGETFAITI